LNLETGTRARHVAFDGRSPTRRCQRRLIEVAAGNVIPGSALGRSADLGALVCTLWGVFVPTDAS